jgi:hypothetical protein
MSPASYRAAPPRVGSLTLAQPVGRLQNDPPEGRWPAGEPAGHLRKRDDQLLGVGAAAGGVDGGTDGPVAGAEVPAAAFCAVWKACIAVSRSLSA